MDTLVCDSCKFEGNNIQVRIFNYNDEKIRSCGNCIPYHFMGLLEETMKVPDIKELSMNETESEIQNCNNSYMEHFINYQQSVKTINEEKEKLFEHCKGVIGSQLLMKKLKEKKKF